MLTLNFVLLLRSWSECNWCKLAYDGSGSDPVSGANHGHCDHVEATTARCTRGSLPASCAASSQEDGAAQTGGDEEGKKLQIFNCSPISYTYYGIEISQCPPRV